MENTTDNTPCFDPETGEILEAPAALDLSCVSTWDEEEPQAPAPEGDLSTLKGCMAVMASLLPPVVALPPAYPFRGKNQVKKDLNEEGPRGDQVRTVAIALLVHMQTEDERTARDTKHKNKRGLMSSHAWHGTRIGQEIIAGASLADLEPEDQDRVSKYARVYSKQIAAALRAYAVSQEPELEVSAASFFGG